MSIDVDWTGQASNKYLQNKNRPTAREFKLEEHEVEKVIDWSQIERKKSTNHGL